MAVNIDGPVGFRWRRENVRNNSRDQAKIVSLLAAIPAAQGGKKEAWVVPPLIGPDGSCPQVIVDAIRDFQTFWKPAGGVRLADGVVDPGMRTIRKLNELTAGGAITPPAGFVCGPDVTAQVIRTWTKVQTDFRSWSDADKESACNKILLPVQFPKNPLNIPTDLDELKKLAQQFADINGWDTLPLFQGTSLWLRTPPVFDSKTNGPCATPSSSDPTNSDQFAAGHEDDATCSNTVQIGGECWLNGSVNYGLFGVMVRLCNDYAKTTFDPIKRTVYSLDWAKMLIKAYKKFGANPEGAIIPVAWTEATFNGGVAGKPTIAGNRPKCKCSCGCSGDVVKWDYVWEPKKPRSTAIKPK